MKNVSLLLIALLISMAMYSQNCDNVFPNEKGTFIEMKSYDANGDLSSTSRQTINDVNNTTKGINISVQSELLDKKDKSLGTSELVMRCENGVFFMDMKSFFNQASLESMKDMEMSVDGVDLEFPSELKVNETLKDGNMTIVMKMGGVNLMTMTMNIFNRKVDAIEDITTPAGTYQSYKISYDFESKIGKKMTGKAIQWYAKSIGAVRTETYDDKGKLTGHTELTAFRK